MGAKDTDEAIGKIRAGVLAIGERDGLLKAFRSQEQAGLQKEFRGDLKAAIKEGRLSLGELRAVIPTFLKDESAKKANEAIAKLDAEPTADAPADQRKGYRSQLLDAVCAGEISEKRLASVKAFLAVRQPMAIVPAAKQEPPLTTETSTKVKLVSDQQLGEFKSKYGFDRDAVAALADVTSVDQIEAARKRVASQK